MPRWTNEQQLAIDKSDTNIIVSAGAGSGKTAVLTARTGKILKEGTHINELLILTFTKDAAAEMKDRIRSLIKKDETLTKELELIDTAYVTTFDSFALSIVKKYHYLLNIPKDIDITDESTLTIQKTKILRDILDESYQDIEFQKFIQDYCTKNDQQIFDSLIKITNQIALLPNKEEYLDNYIENFYNEENYQTIKEDYNKILMGARDKVKTIVEEFKVLIDNDFYEKINSSLSYLYKANTIEEFALINNLKPPMLPRNSDEEVKEFYTYVKNEIKNYKDLISYGNSEQIINDILKNKTNTKIIINILKKFYKTLDEYKIKNQIYDFQSIALLAIEIVKNHESARNELKYSFKEIMIDEYQDTNDIQETFVSYIENNNVYMVGDIKQSIYRFRNANPYIFKNKYDNYAKGNNGFKIDLLNNFRSRSEVLDDINLLFRPLMDDEIGGANYEESHQMYYGNKMYDDNKNIDPKYNMKIFTYNKEDNYTNTEIEAFKIANDITEKIKSKYQVFDKNTNSLRDIEYKDFSVIVDKSTNFNLYKKIFEYLNIPSSIKKDDKLNESAELTVITNALIMINAIASGEDYYKFKTSFISLARSYIYELSDQEIFNCFKDNDFKNNKLYNDMSKIAKSINDLNLKQIIESIINTMDYEIKTIKLHDPSNALIRMEKLIDIINSLADKGYDIKKTIEHLECLIEKGLDLKYKNHESTTNAVYIMTIHGSKGLEYPICYFPSLSNQFNIKDLNDLFLYYQKYGIIIPYYDKDYGITKTVMDVLVKDDYLKEEISEKIRLFYVALTRAREQLIMFLPNPKKEELEIINNGIVSNTIRTKYKSIAKMLYSLNKITKIYQEKIEINNLGLTKNYLYNQIKEEKINTINETINVKEINIINEEILNKRYSKATKKLITKEEKTNIELGLKFHEILEYIDFKNYDETLIEDKFIKNKINKLIKNDLFKNIKKCNVYQEYEFINDNTHGIIDLLIEDSNTINIIDYKLSKVSDDAYIKQLNGYKEYIKKISNKEVNIYLYSIINEELIKL